MPADSAALERVFMRVAQLEKSYAGRDEAARKVRAVRGGRWEELAPGSFTDEYPAPMVANRIDVMARDVAASLAPLPSINCQAPSGTKDAPKKFAEKRTKIANHYVEFSNLAATMSDAANSFNCYGLLAFYVCPDVKAKRPKIEVRDGSTVYPVWDSTGHTLMAAEVMWVSPLVLDEEYGYQIDGKYAPTAIMQDLVKVVRYCDRKQTILYLPDCGNDVISEYAALVPGRCQYVCVPRPSGDKPGFQSIPRGAYDDLIYAQLATNDFQQLMLESAAKMVQAPIVAPTDVTDIPYGPDAIIRTQMGAQGVGRLKTEEPTAAFAAMQRLTDDMAIGGMSPEARTGNIQASVITGKGIEAASAGYSSQIALAQIMIGFALTEAIELCFEMDQKLWPSVSKEIRGMDSGVPFKVDYTPSKDIDGDFTVDVTYGFLHGMAANNALVFVLQAQAANLISRDFAARQLPVGLNVTEEQRKIEIEAMRGSILQSLAALAQGLPQFVMNGQDASKIVRSLGDVTKRLQKGEALEDIVVEVLAPEPPPAPPGQAPGAEGAAAGAPGSDGGGGPLAALKQGLATGGPNDRPDLNMFFAGVNSNGNANLQGGVSRQNPVAGQ